MTSPHAPSANDEPDPAHTNADRRQDDPAAPPPCSEDVPLIDRQALRELEEDFAGPKAAHDFARDFIVSWDGKYERLATAVRERDQGRAKEAVLSIKVTSIMVGARRLAQLAVHLEQLIEDNDMDAAARALPGMDGCGSDTRTELLQTYLR